MLPHDQDHDDSSGPAEASEPPHASRPPDSLPGDLRAVALWLGSQGLSGVALSADRHYGQSAPELAYVIAWHPDQSTRRTARAAVARAVTALGHRIEPRPGCDVYDVEAACSRELSHHASLAEIRRVRAAIERVRDPDNAERRAESPPTPEVFAPDAGSKEVPKRTGQAQPPRMDGSGHG